MPTQVTLSIGSVRVKTTVITTVSEVHKSLKDMLYAIYADDNRVVSLNIEKEQYEFRTGEMKVIERVSKVMLCYDTICLIIDLININMRGEAPPLSLPKFLQLQQLVFVGMGINDGLAALEKDYGIKCRNAVDLGQLAANLHNNGVVIACGLLDLAEKVCPLEHDVKSSIHHTLKFLKGSELLGRWHCSDHQVKAATL